MAGVRHQGMAKRTRYGDVFIALPWWANVCIASIVYGLLKYGLPNLSIGNPILVGMARAASALAIPIAALFLAFAVLSAFHAWRRGTLLESQTSLDSIRNMSWKSFEFLVSEAFRRRGYSVSENLGSGADGGIDLVVSRHSERHLVQCKNWKTRTVGVAPVRELYGLVTAESADGGILVCTGTYSKEAEQFSKGKPLRLVDGAELLRMVADVQGTKATTELEEPPTCPKCNSPMVRRTARHGKRAGQTFWGCSTFPACRGTRSADV